MDGQLAAFLGISILVIVTPGQDTLLTIRNVLAGGRRAGIATAFGVSTGQAIWTAGASAGLTALLLASETAFLAVRLLGAGYLVYLGGRTLWEALRGANPGLLAGAQASRGLAPVAAFRRGVLSNLGNPKMAVFFSSLLPQFVPPGQVPFTAMLALGLLFCLMTLAWLTLYSVAIARAGDLFRRSRVRRALLGITGVCLVGLGLRVASEPVP